MRMLSNIFKCVSSQFRRCSNKCFQSDRTPFPGTKVNMLDSGLRIATEERPSPLTCVSLIAEVGPRYEASCDHGAAHFLEHMFSKGFNCMNQQCLELHLLTNGAKMFTKTTREYQAISIVCPTSFVPSAVEIFGYLMTDLQFNACEINMEKQVVYNEMEDYDRNPKKVLFDYLHEAAFQGTPLAKRVHGPICNVIGFDSCSLACYRADHYQPWQLVLATSGNVHHEDMMALACAKLTSIPCDPCLIQENGPARFTGSNIMYRNDEEPFAHVAMAFEVPGYSSSDYFTMSVAAAIIGSWDKTQEGGEHNATRLARAASCGQFCERFQSFYIAYRDVGLWGIYFVANRMNIEDMVLCTQDAWMHLATTTVFPEFNRGLHSAKMQIAKSVEGVVKSSLDIGLEMLYLSERRTLYEKIHACENTSVISVKHFANNYLYDCCPAVAAVGPIEDVPEYNRIRSGMYWLRL